MTRLVLIVAPPGGGGIVAARNWQSWDTSRPWDLVTRTEATLIHQWAFRDAREVMERPFRAPHHTVSEAGLLGGGDKPRPGEVSLAHGGILLLDEIAEFRRAVLDSLWVALRAGESTIVRRGEWTRIPARPALVIGTMDASELSKTESGARRAREIFDRFSEGKIGPEGT
jgi:magnesium chelatase family protein